MDNRDFLQRPDGDHVWVQDRNGFKNYFVVSGQRTPAGEGKFSAANGKYTTFAPAPNDTGTYRFTDNNTVVCTNSAGLVVTWRRESTSHPGAAKTAASDYRAKPALNSLVDAAHKNLPDMILTYVEVQGAPANYWLQYTLYSPSMGITDGGWLGGPKNGQHAAGKRQASDPLKRAIPMNFKVDFADAVATIRKKGLQGGLGITRLDWIGAHGTPPLLAWSIRTADSPMMFPLFVDAQTGEIVRWKRAMDPPNASDAQLKAIWDSFANMTQQAPGQSSDDSARRAMNCVADIQIGLECPVF